MQHNIFEGRTQKEIALINTIHPRFRNNIVPNGTKFGKITVLEVYGRDRYGSITYLCDCECGRQIVVPLCRKSCRKSCGCPSGRTVGSTELIIPDWLSPGQREMVESIISHTGKAAAQKYIDLFCKKTQGMVA